MSVRLTRESARQLRQSRSATVSLRQRIELLKHSIRTLEGGDDSTDSTTPIPPTAHGAGSNAGAGHRAGSARSSGMVSTSSADDRGDDTTRRVAWAVGSSAEGSHSHGETHPTMATGKPPLAPTSSERSVRDGTLVGSARGGRGKASRQRKVGSLLRRVARDQYQLWQTTLDRGQLQKTQAAYQAALSHPDNRDNAQLWFDVARAYVSFRAYPGALELLTRIITDFPKFARLPRVLFTAALVYRRMGLYDHCVTYLMYLIRHTLPPRLSESEILLQLAWTYEQQSLAEGSGMHATLSLKAYEAAFQERLSESGDRSVDRAKRGVASANVSALLLWLESEVRSGHDAPAEVQHWVEWRNNEHEWLGRGQYYQHHGYTVLASECIAEAVQLRAQRMSALVTDADGFRPADAGDSAQPVHTSLAMLARSGAGVTDAPPATTTPSDIPMPRPPQRSGSVSSANTELTELTAATNYSGTTRSSGTLQSFGTDTRFGVDATAPGFWIEAVRTCIAGGHNEGAAGAAGVYMKQFGDLPLVASDMVVLARAGARDVAVKMEAVASRLLLLLVKPWKWRHRTAKNIQRKEAARCIQRKWYAHQQRVWAKHRHNAKSTAALALQSRHRAHIARAVVRRIRAAITIQAAARMWSATRRVASRRCLHNAAALTVQCGWRWAKLLRRVRRRELRRRLEWQQRLTTATVAVQAFVRCRLAVKRWTRTQRAVLRLQCWMRTIRAHVTVFERRLAQRMMAKLLAGAMDKISQRVARSHRCQYTIEHYTREPHKRMHWHPYRHRHTRNSQHVRTETGSLNIGQGSAPNVHGVLRGSDIHQAVPVVAASERAALGVSGNTTRLYADAQMRASVACARQAAHLLTLFEAKEASLDRRTSRRTRRDRRRARMPELRRRFKLLAPAFDPTPSPRHAMRLQPKDQLMSPTPSRRQLLEPLAVDGAAREEGVADGEMHNLHAADDGAVATQAEHDEAGDGAQLCSGCDEYSGSSVGSEFDDSSGYEEEQERRRLEAEEEQRRRERWAAKGLPQADEDPGVHGVPASGAAMGGWSAQDAPEGEDDATATGTDVQVDVLDDAEDEDEPPKATKRDQQDASQLLKVAMRLGAQPSAHEDDEVKQPPAVEEEPVGPVEEINEVDEPEIDLEALLTTPLDGTEVRDTDTCSGPRGTLYGLVFRSIAIKTHAREDALKVWTPAVADAKWREAVGKSVDAVLNLGLRFHHRGCSTLTCHTVRCFEVVIAACVDAGIPIKRIQFTMKYCAVVWGVTKASIRRVHRQVARGFAMYKVRVPDALARQAQPNDAAASAEPSPSSDAGDLVNDVPAVSPRPEVTTPPSPPKVAPAWLDTPPEPQPPVLPGFKPRHSPGGGIASTVPESGGATAAATARSDAPEDIMAPYPSRPEDDAVSVESDWTPRFGEEIQLDETDAAAMELAERAAAVAAAAGTKQRSGSQAKVEREFMELVETRVKNGDWKSAENAAAFMLRSSDRLNPPALRDFMTLFSAVRVGITATDSSRSGDVGTAVLGMSHATTVSARLRERETATAKRLRHRRPSGLSVASAGSLSSRSAATDRTARSVRRRSTGHSEGWWAGAKIDQPSGTPGTGSAAITGASARPVESDPRGVFTGAHATATTEDGDGAPGDGTPPTSSLAKAWSPESRQMLRQQLKLFHPLFGNAPAQTSPRSHDEPSSKARDGSHLVDQARLTAAHTTNHTSQQHKPRRRRRRSRRRSHSRHRQRPSSASSVPRAERHHHAGHAAGRADTDTGLLRGGADAATSLTASERHRQLVAAREEKKHLRATKQTYSGLSGPSRLAATMAQVACKFGDVYGTRALNMCLEACCAAGEWRASLEVCHAMRASCIPTDAVSHALIVEACKRAPPSERGGSMYTKLVEAGVPLMVCLAAAPEAVETNDILSSMFHTFAP